MRGDSANDAPIRDSSRDRQLSARVLLDQLLSRLPPKRRSDLKAIYLASKGAFVRRFLSYGPKELKACLASIDIRAGDTVMMHSAFGAFTGFRGSPREVIDTIIEVLGPNGNLLMVSLPFRSSTYEYLRKGKTFDIRKTASQMGLISETFRRRPGVVRSFHPTHPVLAHGPLAESIIAGHDQCLYACGPGSPFEKLIALKGKILFFNVRVTTMTFFHYVEHLVEKDLDFPLYFDEIFEVPAVDWNGNKSTVKARVFSREAVQRRRPKMLFDIMDAGRRVRRSRVGNTRIIAVDAADVIACTETMARRRTLFYAAAAGPGEGT